MKSDRKPLGARRAELVALCAQQRHDLAQEIQSIQLPLGGGGLRAYFGRHRKVALAVAGVALGFAVTRPRRVLSMAAAGLSLWKVVRDVLPALARHGTQSR